MNSIDIHLATRNGDIDSVRAFLESGGEARELDRYDCEPIIYAVKHDQLEIAKLLLDKGADINCYSILRGDPISLAVWNLNFRMVKFVIEAGANINQVTKNRTPLDLIHERQRFALPRDNVKELKEMENLLVSLGAVSANEKNY